MRLIGDLVGNPLLTLFRLREELNVRKRYYPQFKRVDQELRRLWTFENPYRLARKKGFVYGETPLTEVDRLAKLTGITCGSRVYELGCGRGRAALFLSEIFGARVVGIDCIQEFIERAHEVKMRYALANVEFQCGDMLHTDYSDADVVFVYGTCLTDQEIETLGDALLTLPEGARVIAVSFSLREFFANAFELVAFTHVRMPWGCADVSIERRVR